MYFFIIDAIIETQVSSQKDSLKRRIDELLARLSEGDTIIITEISRLGRSTAEVIHLINEMVKRKIKIMAIKQGLDLNKHSLSSKIIVTIFFLLAKLERDLVSLRTKEALQARKLQGVKLGKPKGMVQKSKFDQDLDRIRELASLGVSIRKMSTILGYNSHVGLNNYLRKMRRVKG